MKITVEHEVPCEKGMEGECQKCEKCLEATRNEKCD